MGQTLYDDDVDGTKQKRWLKKTWRDWVKKGM